MEDEENPENIPIDEVLDEPYEEPVIAAKIPEEKSNKSKQVQIFDGSILERHVMVDPAAPPNSNVNTTLPTIPEEPMSYMPFFYTFRVKPKPKQKNIKKASAKALPFYLELDQTIPVVWTIFNSESQERLGICQLEWALHFLETVQNVEGIRPKDVDLCIEAIQNYLIDEYAELSEESVLYGSSTFSEYFTAIDTEEKSLNYSQMKNSSVKGGDDQEDVEEEFIVELENIKKAVGINDLDLKDSVSKDHALVVLKDWKKEQLTKIEGELKMLHTVEDMMKNVDEENFEGYTDQVQLEKLLK